jgi:hypothetical protein
MAFYAFYLPTFAHSSVAQNVGLQGSATQSKQTPSLACFGKVLIKPKREKLLVNPHQLQGVINRRTPIPNRCIFSRAKLYGRELPFGRHVTDFSLRYLQVYRYLLAS